jgi:NADH-quinone oxidoreductase subunit C
METSEILARLRKSLGETDLVWVDDQPGDAYLLVPREKLRRLAIMLKGDRHLAFDTLMCLSGVHHTEEQDEMAVVYHLYSLRHRHRLTFKVKMDRPPYFPHFYLKVATVSDIWPAAGWMEREVYDMFGIHFAGHQDFRRLLLPPDWRGHPLQKDYREPDAYHGITTSREEIAPKEIASNMAGERS